MKNKSNDEKHLGDCHERWIKRRIRVSDGKDTPEYWDTNQCMFCAYYLLLPGKFTSDWGVCSNEKSPIDGKVAFEHDGCDFYVLDEDYFKSR